MAQIKYYYVGGDIHGDWRPVRNWVANELKTPIEKSAIILLGDVGANYYGDYRDRNMKKSLNKIGIRIYCLRGNHEMRVKKAKIFGNYRFFFDDDAGGPVYVEEAYPNIYYLRDEGDIYDFGEHPTLVVPGAYSIDKNYRLQMGWNWFPDEQLDAEEKKNLHWKASCNNFDYILAHTCPLSWEPYISDLFMGEIDQSKVDKSMERFLDTLLLPTSHITYKHFYFGHFHDDRDLPEDTKATMLFHKIIPLGDTLSKQADE